MATKDIDDEDDEDLDDEEEKKSAAASASTISAGNQFFACFPACLRPRHPVHLHLLGQSLFGAVPPPPTLPAPAADPFKSSSLLLSNPVTPPEPPAPPQTSGFGYGHRAHKRHRCSARTCIQFCTIVVLFDAWGFVGDMFSSVIQFVNLTLPRATLRFSEPPPPPKPPDDVPLFSSTHRAPPPPVPSPPVPCPGGTPFTPPVAELFAVYPNSNSVTSYQFFDTSHGS